MAFSDTHKFRTELLCGQVIPVHHRDLGEKTGELYFGKKWADVAANGISLDDSIHWDNEIDYLELRRSLVQDTGGEQIMLNDKKMDDTIRETGVSPSDIKGTGESKNKSALGKSDQDTLHRKWCIKKYKGTHTDKEIGKDKNFFRKKKIPRSRLKKYPVKPLREQEMEKKQANQEKFEEVAHSNEFEERLAIESVQDDLNEEYWKTHPLEGYPGEEEFIELDTLADFDDSDDEGHIAFIEYEDHPEKNIVTSYRPETDSYDYTLAETWSDLEEGPIYLGFVMWSIPQKWIVPKIDWLKIWTEMDFKRCGVHRSFEYFPMNQFNRPEIRFHSSSL